MAEIYKDTFAQKTIYYHSSYPENPNPSVILPNGVKIIEHLKLTAGSYSALSHEVIGTELGDYIVGDATGSAIFKSPGCFNAGCGYPASHFGDYTGGISGTAPIRSSFDKIDGGAGDDTLMGLGHDDTITGGYGHDLIYGDDDIDEVSGNDLLSGGYGNDTIYGGRGNDTIHGDAGDDIIYGGLGNDSLYGDDGNDYIVGGSADSRLDGGAGSDTIVAGSGSNQIWGNNSSLESDFDVVDYSSYESHDSSRPVLQIQYTNIIISGQRSLHIFKENNAIDTISLVDRIKLPDVGGIFVGNDEANKFWGGVGADSLYGGAGDDTIYGGSPIDGDTVDGANHVEGGDGNDLIYGGTGGAETILGGGGDDTIYGNGKTSSDAACELLHGGAGNDSIFGGIGLEEVEGGAGADMMENADGEGIVIYVNSQTSVVFGLTDTLQNGKFVGNGYGAEGAPDLESA